MTAPTGGYSTSETQTGRRGSPHPAGRCIGCRHPSGSTCGGCGTFVNDGWDGTVQPRCASVFPPSADAPHEGAGWSGPLRCVIREHQPHNQPPLHMNSGITWTDEETS